MSDGQKFVVAVMIAVISAGLAGFFGYSESRTANENERLKSQIATLQREKTQLQRQLDQLKTAQATLQHDYDALKAQRVTTPARRARPAARR